LVALANKYTDVAFIGILTRDNPANAEAFERRFKIPYPTVIDDSILIGFKGSLPQTQSLQLLSWIKQGEWLHEFPVPSPLLHCLK